MAVYFGGLRSAPCGGFEEQYFEYGPRIQQKGPSRHPKGAIDSIPYKLLVQ